MIGNKINRMRIEMHKIEMGSLHTVVAFIWIRVVPANGLLLFMHIICFLIVVIWLWPCSCSVSLTILVIHELWFNGNSFVNNLFLKKLLKNKEFKEAMNLEVVKLSIRYLL